MLSAIFFLMLGLGLLILGADRLVLGSASISRKAGISELAIGLTIVALGTSMPELIVNIFSALSGSSEIGIGNVIGSNTFNILVILGLAAVIRPLVIHRSTVWKEIPFALLAILLVLIMGNDAFFDVTPFNGLTRTDGLALISFFIIFLYYIFGMNRVNHDNAKPVKLYSFPLSFGLIGLGIGGLFLGGKIVVDNAVIIARLGGLSESLIGLTIVAAGTSLPELATSVVAAIHKRNDIAIGNIVGSNIFNVFWVLGLTSTLLPLPFNPMVNFDVLVCLGATLILLLGIMAGKKYRLSRAEGVMFLLMYAGYLVYLIQRG
ncbi:MAG: calcium/sodium antiporter [Candidatus Peregrinibacteria bacterium]